jgi:hypothetical protein
MNHNLLRVSSDFKTANSESNSNYFVAYNNVALLQGITRCVMKSADIPNVFYNIDNRGYNFSNTGNNTLTWTDPLNVTALTTIPPGQYNITQLLSLINTAFNAAYTGAVSLILNPLTQKIEISNTSGLFFGISINSTIAPYLGMLSAVPWTTVPFVAFAGFPNLSGLQEIYVTSQKISDCSNMVVASNTMYPVILNIQIDKPFGEWVHYASQHPEIDDIEYPSISQGTNIQLVDIQLRDRWGNIVDLQGLPFNIIIKCYHALN